MALPAEPTTRVLTPEEQALLDEQLLVQGAGLGGVVPVPPPAPAPLAPPTSDAAQGYAPAGQMEVAATAAANFQQYPTLTAPPAPGYYAGASAAPVVAPPETGAEWIAAGGAAGLQAQADQSGAAQRFRDYEIRNQPVPTPSPSASGYYGGLVDPSAPRLQPGEWHSSLLYPARTDAARQDEAARQALMTDRTAVSPLADFFNDRAEAQGRRFDELLGSPGTARPPIVPGSAAVERPVSPTVATPPATTPAATPTAEAMLAGAATTPTVSLSSGGSAGSPSSSGAGGTFSPARSGAVTGDASRGRQGFTQDDEGDRDLTADDFLEQTGGNHVRAAMLANIANTSRRRRRLRGVPPQSSVMRDDVLRAIQDSLSRPRR